MKFNFLFTLAMVYATAKGQQLGIGDNAPSLHYLQWIKGTPVDHFEKGKVYVVEFGATWCTPCNKAIPHLTDIAKKYKDKVQVVGMFVSEFNDRPKDSIHPGYIETVKKYVDKQGDRMQYPSGVDDVKGTMVKTWLEPAGREGIPATFVIDKNGKIAWIGANPLLLDSIVNTVTSDEAAALNRFLQSGTKKTNQDPSINMSAAILQKKYLNEEQLISFSAISKCTGEQKADFTSGGHFITSYHWAKPGMGVDSLQGKIIEHNVSLRHLYYMAYADTLYNAPLSMVLGSWIYPDTAKLEMARRSYGKYWYRPMLEVKDSALFISDYINYINRYNYVLKTSPASTAQRLQQLMREDLKRYFGYNVVVENRKVPCWKLTAIDKKKLLSDSAEAPYRIEQNKDGDYEFRNAQVRDIIFQLEINYGYTGSDNELLDYPELQPPFIDETGIRQRINYVYNGSLIQALVDKKFPKDSFEDYRRLLQKAGFELTRGFTEMKVVVIKDKN
jgi:thiol-disulfide isomerase/thioredoxin